MKIRNFVLCALALAALPQVAIAQTDSRLKPSLDPFARERHPMRSPNKVQPYGELRGNIPSGAYLGNSWTVNHWFKNMREQLYPLGENLRTLDTELQVYDVNVNVTGGMLLKKADATTQAKLDALQKASKAGVLKKLQDYRLVGAKQLKAAKIEGAAMEEVWGAMAAVDADAAVIRQKELVEDKTKNEARKAAIMEKVKAAAKTDGLLSKAKSAISTVTNPGKLKEYLISKATEAIDEALMNNVLMQYAEELKDIDARLVAIEASMKGNADLIVKKRLEDSQARLRKAQNLLLAAGIDRTIAGVEGWDIIDQLASEERIYKNTDVFQTLRDYNGEVRKSAKRLRESGAQYLSMINNGPVGESPVVLKKIEIDIAFVWPYNQKTTNDPQGVGGEFYPWLQQADVTRVYMASQAEWYKVERRKVESYLSSIIAGKHLLVIESTLAQLQKTAGSSTDF